MTAKDSYYKFQKGHKRNLTHGLSKTRAYVSYTHMHYRCYDKENTFYYCYGGRGIDVCDRWHKFENFFDDMGERPPHTSLDRIDNNRDYSPDNCRWATRSQQMNNTRDTRSVEYKGEALSIRQLSEKTGMPYVRIIQRLNAGMSVEDAVTRPKMTSWDGPTKYRERFIPRTHCKSGHEYTEENTAVRKDGSRGCRTCQKGWQERRRLARPRSLTNPRRQFCTRCKELLTIERRTANKE